MRWQPPALLASTVTWAVSIFCRYECNPRESKENLRIENVANEYLLAHGGEALVHLVGDRHRRQRAGCRSSRSSGGAGLVLAAAGHRRLLTRHWLACARSVHGTLCAVALLLAGLPEVRVCLTRVGSLLPAPARVVAALGACWARTLCRPDHHKQSISDKKVDLLSKSTIVDFLDCL